MSAFLKNPARPILSVDDSAALRSEPSTHLTSASLAIFLGAGANFLKLARFVPSSTDADDGSSTWKPSNLAGGDAGRWKVLGGESGAHTYVKRKSDGTIDGASGSSPDFSDHVLHVNTGGATPSTGLYGLSVNITLGANRRGVFYDPANSTFAIAEDTLGDDTTIAGYYPLRVSAMRATSFENSAGGTAASGLIRLASGDEMKARIGATTYRLLAALSGPIVALGDSAATTLTLDAAGTIKMTVASGNFDFRGGAYTWKSADGSTTFLDASVGLSTFKVYARHTVYDGSAVAQLDVDTSTGATAVAGIFSVTKSGIGTTKTRGITLSNTTVSGSQVSPQLGLTAFHSGGTQHNFGMQLEPQSASRSKGVLYYGTGSGAPASTFFTLDTSDPSFGIVASSPTFVATLNGFRMILNGGGMKENGSGRILFQSAVSGEPWEALASTSTSNTGARFQLTADAGTPTAGYFLRVGYGSGSFSTEVFSISSATATMGRVKINGVPIGWNLVETSTNANVAIGDRFIVHGGGITLTLPPVPSTVSTRDADVIITEIDGGVLVTPITINAAAGDFINGASSATIGVGFGSLALCHDGDGTHWRIVSSHLL